MFILKLTAQWKNIEVVKNFKLYEISLIKKTTAFKEALWKFDISVILVLIYKKITTYLESIDSDHL